MRGKHLTEKQRDKLMRVYFTQGYEASAKLADKFGVLHGYAAALARKRGHYAKTEDGTLRRVYQCRERKNRLWQIAIERGSQYERSRSSRRRRLDTVLVG